jgi:hypothetical protein
MKIPDKFDWHFALGLASDKYVLKSLVNTTMFWSPRQPSQKIVKFVSRLRFIVCLMVKNFLLQACHFINFILMFFKLGYQYVLVVIGNASRFNWVNLLKSKSESEVRLLSFFEDLKNKICQVPAYLHSDRGVEFSFSKFLEKL